MHASTAHDKRSNESSNQSSTEAGNEQERKKQARQGLGVANMSVSDDIGNLFQRFGGNPDRYQEVARDDDAKHAASRWPLLSAVDIAQPEQVPGAGRPAPTMSAVQALSTAPATRTVGGGVFGAGVQPAATEAATEAADEAKPVSNVRSTAAGLSAADTPAAASAEDGNVTLDPVTSALPRSPLFARGHRHAMMPPPVDAARQAASRFSPPPQAAAAASDAEATARQPAQPTAGIAAVVAPASPARLRTSATAAATAAATPSVFAAPPASTTSAADPRAANDATREAARQPHAGFFANRKQTFAPAPITGAIETVRAPAQTEAQRRAQTTAQPQPQPQSRPNPLPQSQPQPAPQASAQRSILSGLFTAQPAHETEPSPQPATRDLATVFARLAGAARRDDKNPGGERS